MHVVNITVLFLVCLPWGLPQRTVSSKPCANFSFENDTLQTNSEELTENTTVTVMFYLKNKTCSSMENIVITIRRLDTTTNSYTPQCDIVLKNGTCQKTKYEHVYCGCLNTFGAYKFSKIVSISDITRWKWTTKDGLADDVYIWFNESFTDRQHTSVSTVDNSALSKPSTSPARMEARSKARTEARSPARTEATPPARTEARSKARTEARSPARTEATPPARTEARSKARTEARSPARMEATPPARTEDLSQENKGAEEMYKSIAIAVVAILLLINVFFITLICLRKRGQEKLVKSPTCAIADLDALRLNQTYNGQTDSGALHTDILHNDDFTEIYFSNNFELD